MVAVETTVKEFNVDVMGVGADILIRVVRGSMVQFVVSNVDV